MRTACKIALPAIPKLRRLARSLAMLDAVLSPDWELRNYSFNQNWADGEQVASMRNGEGDEWFLMFSAAGAGLKGFAHESPAAAHAPDLAARVRAELPRELAGFRDEPAFGMQDVSFCAYRLTTGRAWRWITTGEPDGAPELLELLDGRAEGYQRFALEYYERDVPLSAIKAVYAHATPTAELLAQLNPEVTLASVQRNMDEIGYPDDRPPR